MKETSTYIKICNTVVTGESELPVLLKDVTVW